MKAILERDKTFYKKIFVIALPIIIQNFITSSLNIVDTIMIGKLGEVEIASVGIGNQLSLIHIYLPKEGLWVVGVTENSPAAKAGIQPSDLIIKFDGKEVKTFDELSKLKSNKNAGDKVEVVVYRNGKNVSLSMQLAES